NQIGIKLIMGRIPYSQSDGQKKSETGSQ
ncbi:MAG: hypothetical protein ACJAS9_003423, partial [Polaribacter sp.]